MASKKVQLVTDDEAQATLQSLVESTNAESMAHVLRDALGVYDTLHKMLSQSPGIYLAIVDRHRQELQELNVPSFNRRSGVVVANRTPMGKGVE